MAQFSTEDFTLTHVGHLPIVKHYAQKLNLVETVNTLVDSQMELSPGIASWPWFSTPSPAERLYTS